MNAGVQAGWAAWASPSTMLRLTVLDFESRRGKRRIFCT